MRQNSFISQRLNRALRKYFRVESFVACSLLQMYPVAPRFGCAPYTSPNINKTLQLLFVFLGLVMVFTNSTSAATIRGQVIASDTGITLQDARVAVEGTDLKVVTERGGTYQIRGVKPGTYDVVTSYVGYPELRQTVTIADTDTDVTANFDFGSEEIVELEQFTVEGSLVGTAKAINVQRSADIVKSVVSADAIGQFVDRNAAEALQRLPGISIEANQGEGTFVIIRGADPALNEIAIDGIHAATPEENGRQTSLNIVPISQLESIEVSKTWTPNQSANNIGGSVNLITRSALDRGERFASAEFAMGAYDISDENSFRFNANFGDVLLKNKNLAFQISYDQSEDNRGSETLTTSYIANPSPAIDETTLPWGFEFASGVMEDFVIVRKRTGISGKLEYELNENHRVNFSGSYNKFDSDEIKGVTNYRVEFGSNDYTGRTLFTAAVAEELGLDTSDPDVAARLGQRLTFDEAVDLGDLAFDSATQNYTFERFAVEPIKAWESKLTTDTITTIQIGGEHRFLDWLDVDWKVYQSDADKTTDQENILFFSAARAPSTIGIRENGRPLFSQDGDILNEPSNYFYNSNRGTISQTEFLSLDERKGFTIDAEGQIRSGEWSFTTKAGVALDKRTKEVDRKFIRWEDVARTDQIAQQLKLDESFFGAVQGGAFLEDYGDYDFGPRFDTDKTRAFLDEQINAFRNEQEGVVSLVQTSRDLVSGVTEPILGDFLSTEDVTAVYLMETIDWGSWRFIGGFRYEKTENTYTNRVIDTRTELLLSETSLTFAPPRFWGPLLTTLGPDAFTSVIESARDYDNLLPALHVVKRFGDQNVVRASYTETIARPKFTDLLPFESVIVNSGTGNFNFTATLGNFDLQPTGSQNFDLSFEHYFKGVGLFGVYLFHKNLDGPIYEETRTVVAGNEPATFLNSKYNATGDDNENWGTSQVVNAGQGEITGVEFAIERKLDFLPGPLDGFGVGMNVTFIDSDVELLVPERKGEVVSLFKQSSELANLSVYYEKRAFMVRASLAWRGEYLDQVETDKVTLGQLTRPAGDGGIIELAPLNSFDIYVADFLKLDIRAEYRFRGHWTAFFEGTNLTSEPLEKYIGNESRIAGIVSTQSFYFVGLKWNM